MTTPIRGDRLRDAIESGDTDFSSGDAAQEVGTMPRAMRRAVVVLLLTAAAGMQYVAATAYATGDELASADTRQSEARRFRATFGLSTDAALIRESLAGGGDYSDAVWGVPLTNAESDELMARLDAGHRLRPALQHAAGLSGFAGFYFDQQRRGRPTFMFKGETSAHDSELRTIAPPDITFDVLRVDRSIADLETVRTEITSASDDLSARGITLTLTAIKPSLNALVVGVDQLTPQGAEYIITRFGPGVVVREQASGVADACVTFNNCPPPKGGIKMTWSLNAGSYCTVGYNVERQGATTKYAVTAGHCFVASGGVDGDDWNHNGAKIGDARTHTWANGADADVGLLQLTALPADYNLVLATEPNAVLNVNSVRIPIEQAEGDPVCRMGATSGRDCGVITDWRVTNESCFGMPEQCRSIDMTNEVDFDSTGGDSGGPVYQYYRACSHCPLEIIAYGTHVHSEDDAPGAIGWFSPVGHGMTAHFAKYGWTYTVCTTTAC